jgi:hypothetical protein
MQHGIGFTDIGVGLMQVDYAMLEQLQMKWDNEWEVGNMV